MLELTHSTVFYPITKLFNLSLKTHTCPDLRKIVFVMPLFKKGKSRFGWRRKTSLSPPVKYFTDRSKAVLLLWIFYVFSVLCLLCLCMRLFICAL